MRVVANRAAETITVNVPSRFSSLIVELPVQQTGSGDPSPENIRPITQWTDVALYVADTDTATEPTVTTTFPTPIFGGMLDVARGEVASLYNEKKSSSGWEMVEAGQFRCQVGAFNNGDETSTNVADLYSSHYKTVSNKDAYDATDDLTCGTPTIEGVTYLYVNDLDYSTLEDFTAYIGDVQFVYKSHVPMSDVIDPTIVYLPEGTSYVWAEGAYVEYTVTGTPPLSLTNSMGKPLESWSVELSPKQDLHGYDAPWPAGGGKNKLNPANFITVTVHNVTIRNNNDGSITLNGTSDLLFRTGIYVVQTDGTYILNGCPTGGGASSYQLDVTRNGSTLAGSTDAGNGSQAIALQTGDVISVRIAEGQAFSNFVMWPMLRLSTESDSTWSPYSNICPIYGTNQISFVTAGKNLANLTVAIASNAYEHLTPNSVVVYNDVAGTYRSARFSICKATDYAGQTVTLSVDCENISGSERRIIARYYDTDNVAYGSILFEVTGAHIERTFTIPSDIPSNINLCLQLYSSGSTSEIGRVSYSNIQLELGSTATNFIPYIAPTQTEITLPQTVYDGTVGSDGAESGWASYTATGNETLAEWILNGTSANIAARILNVNDALRYAYYEDGAKNAMCDMLPQVTNIQMYNVRTNVGICVMNNKEIAIQVDGVTTLEEMSAWLAENRPTFVYKKATPTQLSITSPTIPTPKGTATAWATAEDGTVDSMTVTYIGKV